MLQTKIEICKTHTDLKKFTAGLVFAQQLFLGESQHLTIQPSSPTAAAQEERNTAPWIQIWDMVHKCSNPMHFVESAELKAFIDKYYPTVTTQGEGNEIPAEIDKLAQQYADDVMPYVWPKNKHGEDIVQPMGTSAPPFSAKHKREQKKIVKAFIAGYAAHLPTSPNATERQEGEKA